MTVSSPSEAAPAAESANAQTAASGTEIPGQDTQSPPPSDEGAKAPASVFDAVNSALKAKPEALEKSPPSETGKVSPNGEDDSPLTEDPSADELNRLHSQTRKRVKQLLRQRDEARTEVGSLKTKAEQADRINGYVQSSGLSWEEVNSGFELMRLMKTDPFEARERLEPIWNALNKVCGVELPPELKQKVAQGYVDEDTARELAQSKARAQIAQSAQTRTVETVQRQQEQTARQQFGASVTSAIKTFEDNWRKTDPDHAALSGRVQEKVELILSRMAAKGETLRSPADAVKIVEDARNAVRAEMKPFIRKREQIDPLPGGGVASGTNPKPKSMAEAIAQGLRA